MTRQQIELAEVIHNFYKDRDLDVVEVSGDILTVIVAFIKNILYKSGHHEITSEIVMRDIVNSFLRALGSYGSLDEKTKSYIDLFEEIDNKVVDYATVIVKCVDINKIEPHCEELIILQKQIRHLAATLNANLSSDGYKGKFNGFK